MESPPEKLGWIVAGGLLEILGTTADRWILPPFPSQVRCRSSALLSGLGLAGQLKHATTSSSEVPCPRNLAHLQ